MVSLCVVPSLTVFLIRNPQRPSGSGGGQGSTSGARESAADCAKCHLFHHPHSRTMGSPTTTPTSTNALVVSSAQLLSCVQTLTLVLMRSDTRVIHRRSSRVCWVSSSSSLSSTNDIESLRNVLGIFGYSMSLNSSPAKCSSTGSIYSYPTLSPTSHQETPVSCISSISS